MNLFDVMTAMGQNAEEEKKRASLINALMDENFRADVGQGLVDSTNRAVANVVGAPVDLATTLTNLGIAGGGFAAHELGLINSLPELIDPKTVPGSSEYIGAKMQSAGMVSPNRNPVAELGMTVLAPTLSPAAAQRLFALDQALLKNAGAPRTLSTQAGVVRVSGGKSKAAARNQKKGATSTVFDNVTDYDEAMAMARRGAHLKQDKSGQYIGGPRTDGSYGMTVDSPQALAAMRRSADDQVEEGLYNAAWYDRARSAATDAAGGANTEASLFARGGAAYSPQATPPTEMNSFFKQHNAKVVLGEDVTPRTKKIGRAHV